MPIKDDLNKIFSNVKIDSLVKKPISSIKDNGEELFTQFQKFRKLLGECSVTDGMSVNSLLTDIKAITVQGQSISSYLSNPNKIACFATAILGLETFSGEEISKVKDYIRDYKIGFLPYLEDIFKSITTEFNPSNINIDFKKILNESSSALIDIGAGFILSETEKYSNKAEDFVRDKIDNYFSKIGRYFTFLMVASSEFKWAMYLIYIENLKAQTEGRINNLIKLKNSIRNLVYEIDNLNKDFEVSFSETLENYIGVLSVLENTVELNKNIEFDIYNYNTFNQLINDNLIGNLDTAKKLLIAQRNSYLEKITESKEPIYIDDRSFSYILPNDLTTSNTINIINESVPLDKTKFLKELSAIENIFIESDLETIFYDKSGEEVKSLNNGSKLFIELYSEPPVGTEHIRIGKYMFKILSTSIIDPTINKFLSGFQDKPTEDKIYITELSPINAGYYTAVTLPLVGQVKPYFKLEQQDYTLETRPQSIIITDDSYTITEKAPEEPKENNTIVIKPTGLAKVKAEWGENRSWRVMSFINYIENKVVVEFTGEMPNFPEQDATTTDISADLPKPYDTVFSQFANTDNINLNDITNINGTVSNFLYGKDLLNGSLDKFGNNLSSYSEFIKTGADVLQTFCPLKNSMYTYYSLLQQLPNLKEREANITNEINKSWILKINKIISDTLNSMTIKDIDGQYLKINEIKNSTIYYKLIPSIILDYDNLTNLNKLANFNNTLGKVFNTNSLIESKITEFDTFLSWFVESNKLETLKNIEAEMWNQISSTFIGSLNLLLKGENVSSLKEIFDNIEIKIDNLTIELADLMDRLAVFNVEEFTSHNEFLELLKTNGLEHWNTYFKEGKFDIFVKEKTADWVGQYGPAIKCLTTVANKYFSGVDKNFLLGISNYLSYIDTNRLLSLIDLGDLNMSLSIDVNFLNKVPTETINNLKDSAKKISLALGAKSKLENKKNDK